MPTLRIQILNGSDAGRTFEPDTDAVGIGRAEANQLRINDQHVSTRHARILVGDSEVVLEDLESTNGTWLIRDGQRLAVAEATRRVTLRSGDVLELGGQEHEGTRLQVSISDEADPGQLIALKALEELPDHTTSAEHDRTILRELGAVHRSIASSSELGPLLVSIADAALSLVTRATHATIVLREDLDEEQPTDDAVYVPVMTRQRHPDGSIGAPPDATPITRSVVRKVVRERAAVVATDAPSESFSSESLLGASIHSTIGVPLFRGQEILGVLQVDSRGAPALFGSDDLDTLGILCAHASLAVANAQLIRRLSAAERRLASENVYLKQRERTKSGSSEIIGSSTPMRELLSQLDKVVDTKVTVLIEGETGTGKELVASAVHTRSRRSQKLFVAQNCAALPENLLESELFGHRRGAFTGATEEKKGLFEIADGGTLFLDEVSEMALALQAKLLRVLQEGEIRSVGATHSKHVDVRIVAACNRDLEAEVAAGRFREDLYYRLKVFPLRVPPLRERRDDIPVLAGYFLERYTREIGKPIAGFSQAALELLAAYDWPGNVRELQNEVQRVVIQADSNAFVGPELLSPRVRKIEGVIARAGLSRGALKDMVEQVEKYLLLEALREHDNNKTSAARTLGITREGLHKKLKLLGL